jgi:hypothetical protein
MTAPPPAPGSAGALAAGWVGSRNDTYAPLRGCHDRDLRGFSLPACGDDDDGGGDGNVTFEREGFPFTFEYPDSFELTEDVSVAQTLGGGSDDSVALALDDDNAIIVSRFTLNVEVDESNLAQVKQEADQLFQQVDPSAEAQPGEIAGFPSLSLDAVAVPIGRREPVHGALRGRPGVHDQLSVDARGTARDRGSLRSRA